MAFTLKDLAGLMGMGAESNETEVVSELTRRQDEREAIRHDLEPPFPGDPRAEGRLIGKWALERGSVSEAAGSKVFFAPWPRRGPAQRSGRLLRARGAAPVIR